MMTLIFILSCWLFYAGGRNDRFKSGGKWLSRHIWSWAPRDWTAGFLYTQFYQFDLFLLNLLELFAVTLIFYALFRIGYGWYRHTNHQVEIAYQRPAWYIWRPVQILPGIVVGLIFRFLV